MANSCAQVFGCILACFGLTCLIVGTCVNEWKTYSHSVEGLFKSFTINMGLWMECTVPSTSKQECSEFDLLEVPADIQVTRAIMIVSIVLSMLGLVVTVLGMKCTLCLDTDDALKGKVAFTGGMLLICSGVCALGIVSWYANDVVTSFHHDSGNEVKYTLGKCLFLGWGGALLSIIGGAFLACCSLSKSFSRRAYISTPMQLVTGKEYV
ncbi:claudin-7 [Engraulis encrasicolus]|uniref:claudin-7 n=1 Tax=Engraulis encrasicolus TaxID=184585 RepID=UPI002FD4BD62